MIYNLLLISTIFFFFLFFSNLYHISTNLPCNLTNTQRIVDSDKQWSLPNGSFACCYLPLPVHCKIVPLPIVHCNDCVLACVRAQIEWVTSSFRGPVCVVPLLMHQLYSLPLSCLWFDWRTIYFQTNLWATLAKIKFWWNKTVALKPIPTQCPNKASLISINIMFLTLSFDS